MLPVSVGLYACVDSLVSLFALLWIGFVVWLASRLGFVEAAVRKWPRVFTLGLFGREPERAALMKQTSRFVVSHNNTLVFDLWVI
jgi:hypothetical protein